MKCFILGGSRAEQLCLKPQRFSSRDESWNFFYCHAYKQRWEAFAERLSQLANSILMFFVARE